MTSLEELSFEIHCIKTLLQKQQNKIEHLKKTTKEQQAQNHALQSHFNTYKTCVDVFIDTMKQLKVEYKSLLTKTFELENRVKDVDLLIEQRSPDMVMVTTFQELHINGEKKIRHLELRLKELEENWSRFNSPIHLDNSFNFNNPQSCFTMSPSVNSSTVGDNMSPFTL